MTSGETTVKTEKVKRTPQCTLTSKDHRIQPTNKYISDTLKPTPMMIMQHPRHLEGPTSRIYPNDYSTVASYADSVEYCRLCLARSLCPSTPLLMNDATHNGIIIQTHINLANLPSRSLYRRGSRGPRRSGKLTSSSFQ